MKLNEQLNRINRLLKNPIVFPEKKETINRNINEVVSSRDPIPFPLTEFLEKLVLKTIPLENKIARAIIEDLSRDERAVIKFDSTVGIIKEINLSRIADEELIQLFRIPQVREALEEAAKNFRPQGPNGNVVPFNLKNTGLARLFPNSTPAKIINAFTKSESSIANVGKFVKTVIIPFNRWCSQYLNKNMLKKYFVDPIKYNQFLRKIKYSVDDSDWIGQMNKTYDDAAKLGQDWIDAVNTKGRTDFRPYEEKFTNMLKEFKLMENRVKKKVFLDLKDSLPKELVDMLDAQVKENPTYNDLNKMWNELTNISDTANVLDERYTFYIKGMLNIFTNFKNLEFTKGFTRIGNFLIRLDFRLKSEVRDNRIAAGYPLWLVTEATASSMAMGFWYGVTDYVEAYYKNIHGQAYHTPEWMKSIGIDSSMEPDKDWDQPYDPKKTSNTLNNVVYFLQHSFGSGLGFAKNHFLQTGTSAGPIPKAIINFYSDPNRQKKRRLTETELHDELLEAMKKRIMEYKEYKNATPEKQQEMIQDSTNLFEKNFEILNQVKESTEKLNP